MSMWIRYCCKKIHHSTTKETVLEQSTLQHEENYNDRCFLFSRNISQVTQKIIIVSIKKQYSWDRRIPRTCYVTYKVKITEGSHRCRHLGTETFQDAFHDEAADRQRHKISIRRQATGRGGAACVSNRQGTTDIALAGFPTPAKHDASWNVRGLHFVHVDSTAVRYDSYQCGVR